MSSTLPISIKSNLHQISENFDHPNTIISTTCLLQQIGFQYREYHCLLILQGSSDITLSVRGKSDCEPRIVTPERIRGGFNNQICGSDWIPILGSGKGVATITETGKTVGSQWDLLPIIQKDGAGQLSLNLQFRLYGAAGGSSDLDLPYNDVKSLSNHLKQGIESNNFDRTAKKFATTMIEKLQGERATRANIKEILELSVVLDDEIIKFLIEDFLKRIDDNEVNFLQGLNQILGAVIANSKEEFVDSKLADKMILTLFDRLKKLNKRLVGLKESEKSPEKETLRALIQIFETISFLGGTVDRDKVSEESVKLLEKTKERGGDDELKFLIDCALQAVAKLKDNSSEMREFIKRSKVVFKSLRLGISGIRHMDVDLLWEAISNRESYPKSLPEERLWFEDLLRTRSLLSRDPPTDFVGQPNGYELGKNRNLTFAVSISLIDLVFDKSRVIASRLRGIEYLYEIYTSDNFWQPTPFLKQRIEKALRSLEAEGERILREKIAGYQLPNKRGEGDFRPELNLFDEPVDNHIFMKVKEENGAQLIKNAKEQAGQQERKLSETISEMRKNQSGAAKFCNLLPFMPATFSRSGLPTYVSKEDLNALDDGGIIRIKENEVTLVNRPEYLESLLNQEQKTSSIVEILTHFGSFPDNMTTKEGSERARMIAAISDQVEKHRVFLSDDQIAHFLRAGIHLTEYTTEYSGAKTICQLVMKRCLENTPFHFFALGILGKTHRLKGQLDNAYNAIRKAFNGLQVSGDEKEYFHQVCLDYLRLLIEQKEFGKGMDDLIATVDGKLDATPQLKAQFLIIQAEIALEKDDLQSGVDFLDQAEKIATRGELNRAIGLTLRGEIAFKKGNISDVASVYEKAHIVLQSELGSEHPATAESRFNLAIANVLLRKREDFVPAANHYEKVFIRLNREHYKLVHLYLRKGELAAAKDKAKETAEYDKAQFILRDTPHPVRVEALLALAQAYFKLGKYNRTEAFCNETITLANLQGLKEKLGVKEVLGEGWALLTSTCCLSGKLNKNNTGFMGGMKHFENPQKMHDKVKEYLEQAAEEKSKRENEKGNPKRSSWRNMWSRRKNQTALTEKLPNFSQVRSSSSGNSSSPKEERPLAIGSTQTPNYLNDRQRDDYTKIWYTDLYATYQILQQLYTTSGQLEDANKCTIELQEVKNSHPDLDAETIALDKLEETDIIPLHIDAAVGWNRIGNLEKAEIEYKTAYSLAKRHSLPWEYIVRIGSNLNAFYWEQKNSKKAKEIFEDLLSLRYCNFDNAELTD